MRKSDENLLPLSCHNQTRQPWNTKTCTCNMLLHLIFLQVLSMIIGAMTILILQKAYKIKRLNHKKLYAKLAYRLDQMKKESQRLSAVRHLVNERLDTVNCFIAAEMSHRHDYAAAMLDKLTRDSNYFMESTKASFEIAHPEFLDFLKDSGLSEWEIGCWQHRTERERNFCIPQQEIVL